MHKVMDRLETIDDRIKRLDEKLQDLLHKQAELDRFLLGLLSLKLGDIEKRLEAMVSEMVGVIQ